MTGQRFADKSSTGSVPSWVSHASASVPAAEVQDPVWRKVLIFVGGLSIPIVVGGVLLLLLRGGGQDYAELYDKAEALYRLGKTNQALAIVQQAGSQIDNVAQKKKFDALKSKIEVSEKIQVARQLRASGHFAAAAKLLEELLEVHPEAKDAQSLLKAIRAEIPGANMTSVPSKIPYRKEIKRELVLNIDRHVLGSDKLSSEKSVSWIPQMLFTYATVSIC